VVGGRAGRQREAERASVGKPVRAEKFRR
jgi:hypothetical protein